MFDVKKGLKLKELYIEKYKVFEDFTIDFCDSNDNPLPIIVIAGVNGTGKTTILDTIASRKIDKIKTIFNAEEKIHYRVKLNMVHYFMIDKNLNSLETIIKNYIDSLIYEKYIPANMVYDKLREYINKLFSDMNLMIEFAYLNKKKQIFLSNKKGDIFPIKDISTGERTLFTKVLSLYLSEIKDSVILIDEPELSLHPAWQNRVLKLYENFANKNNCQIIIATHSPHIIGNAKNEYMRLLHIDNDRVEVINNPLAYGRDIEWVLQEVMGANYTRDKKIVDKFEEIERLINQKELDKAQKELDKLEDIIGSDDRDILKFRNEIAFERMDFEEDI